MQSRSAHRGWSVARPPKELRRPPPRMHHRPPPVPALVQLPRIGTQQADRELRESAVPVTHQAAGRGGLRSPGRLRPLDQLRSAAPSQRRLQIRPRSPRRCLRRTRRLGLLTPRRKQSPPAETHYRPQVRRQQVIERFRRRRRGGRGSSEPRGPMRDPACPRHTYCVKDGGRHQAADSLGPTRAGSRPGVHQSPSREEDREQAGRPANERWRAGRRVST